MKDCKPVDTNEMEKSLRGLESFTTEHFGAERAAWFDAHMKASEGAEEKATQIRKLVGPALNIDGIEEYLEACAKESESEVEEIRRKYIGADPDAPKVVSHEDQAIVQATLPSGVDNVHTLHPFRGTVFSTPPEKGRELLAGGTGTDIFNATISNYWCWARGGGSGLFGSGAGSYNVFAYWWYPFFPPQNRAYGITSHARYRGFYIVRADDGFWTSKYARVVVNQWTNVHQFNWKGWASMNVMDVAGDNINANNRLDTDRHHYRSAVLGAGDLTWILVSVGLYVYARGSGSYSELNFSTGAANFLAAPHVHVW